MEEASRRLLEDVPPEVQSSLERDSNSDYTFELENRTELPSRTRTFCPRNLRFQSRRPFFNFAFLIIAITMIFAVPPIFIPATRIVSLSSLSVFTDNNHNITQTEPVGTETEDEVLNPMDFIPWLESRGFNTARRPFVTIGDKDYVRPLRNLQDRLEHWGYGRDLVVLCLDEHSAGQSYHGYTGYIGKSVAYMKFQVNLLLVQNEYNFIFLDGDVYLTGLFDPFENMLPLEDDSWDIQFQPDQREPEKGPNIGWYFARGNAATVKFFERSYAAWNESHIWDQQIMQDMSWKMAEEENSLRKFDLHGTHYRNFMFYPWEETHFGDEDAIEHFMKASTMVHYTCVEKELKQYFGLNFGGFGDLDSYYSKPPPLLSVSNISGLLDGVRMEVALAAQLAKSTGRTLIWPDSVGLIQQQGDGDHVNYYHRRNFPGVRALNYHTATTTSGIQALEGRYLANQRRYAPKQAPKQRVIDVAQYFFGAETRQSETLLTGLEELIRSIPRNTVIVLDFADYGPHLLRPTDRNLVHLQQIPSIHSHIIEEQDQWIMQQAELGVQGYVAPMLEKMPACSNANGGALCSQVCT